MRFNDLKTCLKTAVLLTAVLLLGAGRAVAQQQVNLTAGPTTVTLPDGSVVPMWGYLCTPLVGVTSTATCASLNPAATGWSPVLITVPAGQGLTINLTNNLSFQPPTPAGGTAPPPNNIPTSLVIVGQLGAGLGTTATSTLSPDHTNAQPVTWPIAGDQPGAGLTGAAVPPAQGSRVQSFAGEVSAVAATVTPTCTVPTGTTPATGCGVLTWTNLRPGTYLIESGTHPSIQGPMGLYGILVVTTAPTATTTTPTTETAAGCAYAGATAGACAVPYDAEVPLIFSEIDPIQNNSVNTAVNTAGFSETMVWSGLPPTPAGTAPGPTGGCGNPSSSTYHQCYPPAVNYTPLYYLINGIAFDKTHATASVFPTSPTNTLAPAAGATTSVLVRMVNAGLRMHVPSIVGSQTGTAVAPATTPPAGFALIAEDGNPLPGLPRVQSEVFMAAGKTYDVIINAPAVGASALPVYDRELSLSGNATARDAGMIAYIGANGGGLPAPSGSGVFAGAAARADTYNSLVAGQTFTVSDPGKGVIANDTNVYGVHLLTDASSGTVSLNANGTFTYTPSASSTGTSDSFTYCANNAFTPATGTTPASCSSTTLTATVTLGALGNAGGITCVSSAFSSNTATYLAVKTPGVLAYCKDSTGYPLTVDTSTAPTLSGPGTGSVLIDANGGFTASVSAAGTYTFSFTAKNSAGATPASGNVTLTFTAGSGLVVSVLDGADHKTVIGDYRWIIEEDRTFYIDPNCTTNPLPSSCTPFGSLGIVPTFGTNFHTSYMPVVATGCTGPLSCESGQTMYDSRPACTAPGVPTGCSPTAGQHIPAVCDVGNGVCRPDPNCATLPCLASGGSSSVMPSLVHLDPTKRYYISVLPGDAANPFIGANGSAPANCAAGAFDSSDPSGLNTSCGHGMGGAPIAPGQLAVTILAQPTPFPPAQLSVFVFEDDFPLNGEQDAGGGVDILASNEPGLGGFEITLFDDAGGTGDATGQLTHDMFNQPLVNGLAGTPDPANHNVDACPIVTTNNPFAGMDSSNNNSPTGLGSVGTVGITGRIVTCPKYEADGVTLSPLAGQAVIPNMMQGRYGVVATPGADRIARGEEWLQTNTLDGQKAHDSFLRIGEPSYFQEYGPAGYHVSIGFANPTIINSRLDGVCHNSDPNLPPPSPSQPFACNNSIIGSVSTERMSRPPDERLYGSGSYDSFAFTQCFVSIGDPDGEDFAFTKCDGNGNFSLSGLPQGVWRVTVFDQWNDMLVDGLSTPVSLAGGKQTNMGAIAMNQWQANLYTTTFFDANGNGVRDSSEAGLTLVSTNIRFRDGSYSNFNNTDLNGNAGFNEIFPLFSWYVVETDTTRYKSTGTHVVYDAGGPADSTCTSTTAPCGNSAIGGNMANTAEVISVPNDLRVPGAVYCSNADCGGFSIANGPSSSPASNCTLNSTTGAASCGTPTLSTGRIDPPWVAWPGTEGWQGFSGQNSFLEFGKKPFAAATATTPAENGGIHGEVNYASTRPFDDPQLLLHVSWTPDVPNVTVNLYQEGLAADGVTQTLKLVDTTKTTSWDDWAQGFRSDGKPNMSCPGQGQAAGPNGDLFYFSLFQQPDYLDFYNSQHNGGTLHTIPYNSQFKCYDGMHNWNQLQPAPYDGMYQFPSVASIDLATGEPTGSNCTICVYNPDSTDPFRYGGGRAGLWTPGTGHGTPMLPAGKYVVEVVVPPGYELVKEEDKNILIGDNYIAPVTQEFGALGAIYILPDQASIGASFNANNAQNQTTDLGTLNLPRGEGDTGSVEQFWPCVGEARIVPDFMSIFPQAQEVAAFAGATRNLCDRKEITLNDQASALAKFYIFSSAHVAAHFTGVITDDFTSEFDPFSPTFGEKFSPANEPVSIKDWAGNEVSRVYSDHWGDYDGLTYSSWEVNPPNPTGYGPTMMVTCMNDKGPILDTRQTIVNSLGATVPNPTLGQMITDPLFNPQYSQFCYEIPFMPGQTQYMDTPVVPTSAFAGAGYNNPDCDYPTLTPAIAEVDGDGVGPWVSATGSRRLTITALGDQVVENYAYSGPSAISAPFNQKTVTRHYGFGSQCTAVGTGCTAVSSAVLIGQNPAVGGIATVPLNITSWSDTTIVATVPNSVTSNPHFPCLVQQQTQYGGSTADCGQLVITAGNGRQSVDAVTVTVGGKAPTHVAASDSIQAAIDLAAPGDLIIVDPTCTTTTGGVTSIVACTTTGAAHTPTTHRELLLMWKPVRLQGVGAASSVIDANTHPAGTLKLDPWRRSVNCLFGLALNGQPNAPGNVFDPTGLYSCPTPSPSSTASGTGPDGKTWKFFYGGPNYPTMVVDRVPLEGIVGWDATVNGNLAEQLQEPSIMGAYEGAAISVLAKGVNIPAGAADPFGSGAEAAFPAGSTLLTGLVGSGGSSLRGDGNPLCHTSSTNTTNPFPSNFQCNPSSIDGLGLTDASQGGGGVFVHAWAHNLQIANNRIYNNAGTLSGGISISQGESPEAFLAPTDFGPGSTTPPGSCQNSVITNTQLPFCIDLNVNIHHNMIVDNSSTGDELFSGTPAGAGGVSICTGSDYYKFNYNWVCGNLSTGDGGGVGHMGFSWNGDIEHNTFLFNQSTNPTIQTNGGGLIIMGAAPDRTLPDGTECGSVTDNDCVPGLSDGTGPGLVINANLFEGNGAEAGSGGAIRLQAVNGAEVARFPSTPANWYHVLVSNNIIDNNVAGWDGAGVSLEDSLAVTIINNTISSNDTTASSGALVNTLGAPLASSQAPPSACALTPPNGGTANATVSCPQPAGLVSMQNSPQLTSSFTTGNITCPAGNFAGTTATNGTCIHISYPALYNNIFWQNRSFQIGVGSLGTGTQNQQNVVTLYNAAFNGGLGTVAGSQSATGACPTGSSYWDIGVRGDSGPADHGSGFTLNPLNGVLSPGANGYSGPNLTSNPLVISQYCNGSRVPPENGGLGYQVPPGIADATVPNPIFTLGPSATVDEGNNWINISWGPLSMLNPNGSTGITNVVLGNYALQTTSPDIDYISCSNVNASGCLVSGEVTRAPATDFFGNPRPDPASPNSIDIGAVETQAAGAPPVPTATVTPTTLAFGNQTVGTTSPAKTLTVTNTGSVALAGGTFTFGGGTPQPFARANALQGGPGTCGATLAIGASCTFNVVFTPGTATSFGRTLTIAYTGATVTGSPVTLTGTGIARGTGALSFTAATNGTLSTVAGVRTLTFTIPTPRAPVTSVVTITNTGTGPLQITAETLPLNVGSLYSVAGTTCSFTTPLAAAGTCTVSIRYATPATRPSLPDIGAFNAPNNGATGTNTSGMLALIAQ